MLRVTRIHIGQGHALYDWCDNMCRCSNNMYNSALYVLRNVLTALDKKPDERHEKEQELLDDIKAALPEMNARRRKDSTPFAIPGEDDYKTLSSGFLDTYFKVTKHSAYYAKGFSVQAAQRAIDDACEAMDSFWELMRIWHQEPGRLSGKPGIPRYRKKGGLSTTTFTNQDAAIYQVTREEQVHYELKLPKLDLLNPPTATEKSTDDKETVPSNKTETDKKAKKKAKPEPPSCMGSRKNRYDLGQYKPTGDLSQVEVVPWHGGFWLNMTFDDGVTEEELEARIVDVPERIAWIDPGVNVFVAAVSNCGAPCLLISGGSLKADNQWYNKRMAEEQSRVTKGGVIGDDGEKTAKKFSMTPVAEGIVRYRENRVHDFLFKCAARVLDWCVENRIDTLGMNYNDTWKDDCKMRHESKQLFMEIPFARFRDILMMKCFWLGIRFEVREESYTSKASFLDNDLIPVFGSVEAREWVSSGRRVERGLFRSADGTLIHADLNGAANGLRKAYPDAFERDGAVFPDFRNVRYLKHPDEEFELVNRARQLERNDYAQVSKSRLRRERRKASAQIVGPLTAHRSGIVYVVPHGIELCE